MIEFLIVSALGGLFFLVGLYWFLQLLDIALGIYFKYLERWHKLNELD